MTLIKSANVAALSAKVRPISAARREEAPRRTDEAVVPVELAALRREVESLGRQLAERNSEVERLRSDVSRAYREGEGEGRKAGLKEADQSRSALLERVSSGVERALERFDDELRAIERIAPALALESLQKVFGEPGKSAELVALALRHQLAGLEASRVLRVDVSAEDFPSQAELDALAASLGKPNLQVVGSALDSGDCRIQLKLGGLDVSLSQQWSRLAGFFLSIADSGARE